MATNAFEAFKVNNYNLNRWLFPEVIADYITWFLQAGSYEESLKHLDSLQELNKEDYKITMNKAINEFYKSGQTTTSTLKQTLMTLKNQV